MKSYRSIKMLKVVVVMVVEARVFRENGIFSAIVFLFIA